MNINNLEIMATHVHCAVSTAPAQTWLESCSLFSKRSLAQSLRLSVPPSLSQSQTKALVDQSVWAWQIYEFILTSLFLCKGLPLPKQKDSVL